MIIKPLDHLTDEDEGVFGSKAVNLGHLIRAGFRVPAGFAVGDFDQRWHKVLWEMYEPLFRHLAPLAVRSSAVGEDGASTSFAGQHDTVLGVDAIGDFIAAVSQVLESVNTPEATAYREQHGLPAPKMGIVTQRMLEPTWAGVAFSHDPVTGAHGVVIESVPGLGDALVSGTKTPDLYLFNEIGIFAEKPQVTSGKPLMGLELHMIQNAVRSIERRMGCPVDVEWALTGTFKDRDLKLWMLQARPITALATAAA